MAEAPASAAPLGSPGSTAAEWSARWFGGPTRVKSRAVTVGTTPTQILGNNPKRVFWAALNRAVNSGAVDFDQEVTEASGIPVGALAGGVSMSVQEDGEPVAWAVWGIQSGASGTWRVVEVERV